MKLKSLAKSIKGVLAVSCLAVAGTFPTGANASCGEADYLGSVCTTAISFCPRGYLELSGQLLTIADHSALFSLLGCRWGGDCRVSFALPDMRGRLPMGSGTGPGLTQRDLGQKFGQELRQITISELPAHSHSAAFQPATPASVEVNAFDGFGKSAKPTDDNDHLQTVAANPFSASTDALPYGPGLGTPVPLGGVEFTAQSGKIAVGNTGSGRPISLINPATVLTYCIAMEGPYPQRN